MIVTMLTFVLLPIIGPWLAPTLRTHAYLLKRTDPAPITRTYTAHPMDVEERQREIEAWQARQAQGLSQTACPETLVAGQVIKRTIHPPRKSVFWSKDIKAVNGQVKGQGLLYVEMVLVDQFVDLGSLPYALVETIRTLIRLLLPFTVIIGVSLMTRPDDRERLDRFYVKMRTPVQVDRALDKTELANSLANPKRFEERLLLPGSQFEFFKWNKVDAIGFVLSVFVVFCIVGFLHVLLHLGT